MQRIGFVLSPGFQVMSFAAVSIFEPVGKHVLRGLETPMPILAMVQGIAVPPVAVERTPWKRDLLPGSGGRSENERHAPLDPDVCV